MDIYPFIKWTDETLLPYFKSILSKCVIGTKEVKDFENNLVTVTGPLLEGKLNGWSKYTYDPDWEFEATYLDDEPVGRCK